MSLVPKSDMRPPAEPESANASFTYATGACGRAYNAAMRLRPAQHVLGALLCVVASQQAPYAQAPAPPPVPETSGVSGCPQSPPVDEAKASNEREISVAELTFEGDLRLPHTDQEQIASKLRQIACRGTSELVADELLERVRRAWQDRGYFKVSVHGDSRILTSNPISERIAVNTHLIEGPNTG
jgi:hypothetical protein